MKKLFITFIAVVVSLSAFSQLKTTEQERAYWNGFVDFIKSKGLKGSRLLDRKDLDISHKLFVTYNKIHRRFVDYVSFVTLVQQDIIEYRKMALEQIRISRAKHNENPTYPLMYAGKDESFMAGLSQLDGFAGVKTTSYKFPKEIVINSPVLKYNDLYARNGTR